MRLKPMILLAVAAVIALVGSPTRAQSPELIFTPKLTRGLESLVPEFTWSTVPVATTCTASGDDTNWTGSKPASGNVTLPAINASKTYGFACEWQVTGDQTPQLSWTPDPTYTNGSPMTIVKYTIAFGPSQSDVLINPPPASVTVRQHAFPQSTGTAVPGLKPGNYFFCVRQWDANNASECGKRADGTYPAKTILAATTQTRSVTLIVDPKPSAAVSVEVK